MSWEYIEASKYCESVKDGTHDTPKKTKNGYKLITGKHIKQNKIVDDDAYYISEEDYNSINKRSLVEKWDVLMSMIGTIGEVAIVKEQPNYAIKNIALFKCGGNEIKSKWLNYYLRSSFARKLMFGNQKGSSQQFMSLGQLRKLPILNPPIETQEKIADILSNYDDLIENNQKQIKLLEEAAQRLYKKWFVDFQFPGHETTLIINNLPKGWKKGRVEDIVIYYDNLRKPLSTMQRSNIKGNYKYYGAAGVIDYINDYIFNGTYLLFGEDGTVITPNGFPVLQYVSGKFWVNNHAHIFTGKAPFSTEFIYLLFSNMKVSDIVTGVAQPKISQARLSAKELLLPDSNILYDFQNKIKPIFDLILNLKNQNEKLTEARDRLLPKLMNEEIKV